MLQFLESLNHYSGALTVIFTAVVTISTVIYAALTGKLVKETRIMREVQTEPKIHITVDDFDFAIHFVRLNIKNIGLGPAEDLKFEPSIISGGESATNLLKEFTESNFFNTGLRYFGPGQNIYSMYTQTTQDYEGKSASVLSFKLSYKSAIGKKYNEEIIIDMSEIKGRYRLGKPNLRSVADSLEKIQKDVGHLTSGFKHLKTDVFTSEDRRKEREEIEKRYAQHREESAGS